MKSEFHLEALHERELQGEPLTPEERAQLEAHVAGCVACQSQRQLTLQSQATDRNEDELVARIAAAAAERALQEGAASERTGSEAEPPRGRRRARGMVVFLIAAGSIVSSAAAATILFPNFFRASEEPTTPVEPAAEATANRRAAAPVEPTEDEEESLEAAEAPVNPPESSIKRRSPDELLRAANAHRTRGHHAAAARAYRRLQRVYPGSDAATVSQVSLGRLLLQRGKPRLAERHFEAYLAHEPQGPLAEEALLGRATSLRGRGSEAEAWRRLLLRFPTSLYAEQARTRIQELADPP